MGISAARCAKVIADEKLKNGIATVSSLWSICLITIDDIASS